MGGAPNRKKEIDNRNLVSYRVLLIASLPLCTLPTQYSGVPKVASASVDFGCFLYRGRGSTKQCDPGQG